MTNGKLIKRVARQKIKDFVHIQLYVNSGGMCEHPGCRTNLLEHHITRLKTNLGEQAHICAYNEGGSRGDDLGRPEDINNINNLMLLCGACHKTIDDHQDKYTIELLRKYKKDHEDLVVDALRGIGSNYQKTQIIVFEAPIGERISQIPDEHCYTAIRPNYSTEKIIRFSFNDISKFVAETDIYKFSQEKIKNSVNSELSGSRLNFDHYSLFALGPIPSLILFGNVLDRNTPCHFYNRQHVKDDWTWVDDSPIVDFKSKIIRQGSEKNNVALMVHTSGVNDSGSLPAEIDDSFYIYEISPVNEFPSKNVMQNRKSLDQFKICYESWRRAIARDHMNLKTISLFPAVSPAIALALGHELIHKVDPAFRIYDKNKISGGFVFALEVNS